MTPVALALICSLLATSIYARSIPVVIDSDGGPDDAGGILLFLWHERNPTVGADIGRNDTLKLVAITTVAGNTGVLNATRNIKKTLEIGGRSDVPVYIGSKNALLREHVSGDFFGNDGFGDFLPELNTTENPMNVAVNTLVNLSKRYEGSLVVICIGPLTNMALAQRQDPSFFSRISELHIMGGAMWGHGNVKYGAEFNMLEDPEAADVVFGEYKGTISVLPFDPIVTNPIPTIWRTELLGNLKSAQMKFLNLAERKVLNSSQSYWSPADQEAVATAVWPKLVTKSQKKRVVVETGGVYSRGVSLIDTTATLENVTLVEEIDVSYFQQLLFFALS